MIRLSIIIPFYNVEKYISACLDSVFNQDIPEDEYEVICVNDGSPDGSRDIVCSYLPLHPNLRLIDHPCNMKLGAARNSGRKAARGNYIWHVDSDDMIAPNCLKHILEVCEKNDLDVLEMCYVNMRGDDISDSTSLHQLPRDNGLYTGPEYMEKFHLPYFMGGICGIWRKVYKRSFLDDNVIYSPPINMGEDVPFAIEVFGLAKRMMYLDRDYYLYRRIEQSLSGEQKKKWSADKWYETSLVCTRYMHQAFSRVRMNYSPIAQQKLNDMIVYNATLWRTFSVSKETKELYWHLVRKNLWINRFIFTYLTRKAKWEYFSNVILWKH